MEGFQASFLRMKDCLDYQECGERQIVMKIYVLLFDLRSQLVGINQIHNVYMPWLESEMKMNIQKILGHLSKLTKNEGCLDSLSSMSLWLI